jgi:hypothetical protein
MGVGFVKARKKRNYKHRAKSVERRAKRKEQAEKSIEPRAGAQSKEHRAKR